MFYKVTCGQLEKTVIADGPERAADKAIGYRHVGNLNEVGTEVWLGKHKPSHMVVRIARVYLGN